MNLPPDCPWLTNQCVFIVPTNNHCLLINNSDADQKELCLKIKKWMAFGSIYDNQLLTKTICLYGKTRFSILLKVE